MKYISVGIFLVLLFVVATSHVITNKTILKGRMYVTQEDLDDMRHSIFFSGRPEGKGH
ncbi:hypothetical protein OAJ74_00585 [Alphaproteobacteria bacterium]|nr:hypothetical protein [Alphaproteobacteria bacterium]